MRRFISLISLLTGVALFAPQATGQMTTQQPEDLALTELSTSFSQGAAGAPNGTNENWEGGVGVTGPNEEVYASAWHDGKLYLGGNFTKIGGKPAGYIGVWDGTEWLSLGGGVNGQVFALLVEDGKLYVGGDFSRAGGVDALDIAVYDIASESWSPLGRGIGGIVGSRVRALAHDGEKLYVGGSFIVAGTTVAVNLAAWNGSAWKRVGPGADRTVYALHVDGRDLYAGGEFQLIGDQPLHGIARYSIDQNSWHAMPGITFESTGRVAAITSDDDYVYIGGRFSKALRSTLNNVGRYAKQSGTWDDMEGGVTNQRKGSPQALQNDPDGVGPGVVYALSMRGDDLFVGGDFDNLVSDPRLSPDDASNQPRDMAKWDTRGNSWSMFPRTSAISGDSYASSGLLKSSRNVASIDDLERRLARDDHSTVVQTFSPLADGSLYIGGSFDFAGPAEVIGDVAVDAGAIIPDEEAVFAANICILSQDDTLWSAVGDNRLDGTIQGMVDDGTYIYAVGDFLRAGPVAVNGAARLEKATGKWLPMGSGLTVGSGSLQIDGIETFDGEIFVGGNFTSAGGAAINGIARWNPGTESWSDVDGKSLARVSGLTTDTAYLAVVGDHGLALWDGSTWTDVPETVNGPIYDVAIDGSNFYIGGFFNQVGEVAVRNVALWNRETTNWTNVAGGIPDTVFAIEPWEEYIYFGGNFRHIGSLNIVRFDVGPQRWQRIGNGLIPFSNDYHAVTTLHVGLYGLYVGGHFNGFGKGPTTNKATSIALWDGDDWLTLGSGLSRVVGFGSVTALASDDDRLHVAGAFDFAGLKGAGGYAEWIFPKPDERPADDETGNLALAPSAAAEDPGDVNWDDRFDPAASPPGLDDEVFALVSTPEGDAIYAGGVFTRAVGADITGVALWDGIDWNPLEDGTGEGVDGFVFTLAIDGDNLYVGGQFSKVGGIDANNVAVWNRSSNTWSALGSGVESDGSAQAFVSDMTIMDGDLYVGGTFVRAGGGEARNVALWDGSSWSPLGSGVEGNINALEAHDGKIFAGGTFGTAGGLTTSNLAFWEEDSWNVMGSGVDGVVNDLEVFRGTLIIGGTFNIDGSPVNLAGWNGTTVSRFTHQSENIGEIRSLFVDEDRIYVGGNYEFDPEPSIDAQKFHFGSLTNVGFQFHAETSAYTPGTPLAEGTNGSVNAFARMNDDIIVGGTYRRVGDDLLASSVAGWKITERLWYPLVGAQLTGTISALGLIDDQLYGAGPFEIDTDPINPQNQIARLGASGWQRVEGSIQGRTNMALVDDKSLLLGGRFATGGGVIGVNIMRWNSQDGSYGAITPGSGVASHNDRSSVDAIVVDGDQMYVGGDFGVVDTFATLNVAAYDQTSGIWRALGDGLNRKVWALAAGPDGELYAGGDFTKSGDTDIKGVAHWDGTAWQPLGDGISGAVRALALHDGKVFVGGTFPGVDGVPSDNVIAWNIAEKKWERAGEGLSSELLPGVDVLTVIEGRLFAAGFFRLSGADSVNNIARWSGWNWEKLGSGVDFAVFAMAGNREDIFVAGSFETAGQKPSPYIALWHDPTLSVEEITAPVAGMLSGGPNPFARDLMIRFSVPTPGPVTIEVHDAVGGLIARLFSDEVEPGEHAVRWEPGSDLSSGLYYCRMTTEHGTIVQKIVRQQ